MNSSQLSGLLFVLLTACADAGKILMSPNSLIPSHRFVMRDLAAELVKRGHEVVWWEIGLVKPTIPLPKGVEERFWQVDVPEPYIQAMFGRRDSPVYNHVWSPDVNDISLKAANWMMSLRLCERLLETRQADFDALVAEQFDTAVIDDLYNPCGLLHVGLQRTVYVLWSMTYMRTETAWSNQSPSPPSYIPVPGTGYADELDFWQRSYNLASYIKQIYIHQRIVLRRVDNVFQRFYPGVTEAFYIERNASVNYINTPPIFDFPRPFMPRVYFVGGLHCRQPQPLTQELESFVSAASNDKGFVLFTTGFTVPWERAPKETVDMFMKVFGEQSDVRFVWQYSGARPAKVPDNVYLAEWLPQQDLLGHPKCRAFISHGGLNSLIEAMYHGVPVLGLPIFTEHKDNLLRVTHRQAGFMLEKKHLNDVTLSRAVKKILNTKKYKENTLEFQDLILDVPYTELNHSAFWVEFIIRHQEIPHARSGADDLNIVQYFLVDVIAFLLACVVLIVATVYYTCKLTCRACGWGCKKACGSSPQKVDPTKKTN